MSKEKISARLSLIAVLPDDALISCREVCAYIDRSKAAVYRDINAGKFPAPLKVGSSSRWPLGVVRAFLQGLR